MHSLETTQQYIMAHIENWVGIKVQGWGTRNNHRLKLKEN
jgi:hypothetical protein